MISLIAAISENRVIGKDNDLIWKISKDKKRFRDITKGHPVIMGRNTYKSIGKALPNRFNIVITRNMDYTLPDAAVAHTLEEAIRLAKDSGVGSEEVFVIGGAQVYAEALPFADKIYITIVHKTAEGDTYFPAYENIFKKVVFEETDEENGIKFTFKDLVK
ncbi:MAG: dihydrofolate reductase [Patescibacteria group bacterium]